MNGGSIASRQRHHHLDRTTLRDVERASRYTARRALQLQAAQRSCETAIAPRGETHEGGRGPLGREHGARRLDEVRRSPYFAPRSRVEPPRPAAALRRVAHHELGSDRPPGARTSGSGTDARRPPFSDHVRLIAPRQRFLRAGRARYHRDPVPRSWRCRGDSDVRPRSTPHCLRSTACFIATARRPANAGRGGAHIDDSRDDSSPGGAMPQPEARRRTACRAVVSTLVLRCARQRSSHGATGPANPREKPAVAGAVLASATTPPASALRRDVAAERRRGLSGRRGRHCGGRRTRPPGSRRRRQRGRLSTSCSGARTAVLPRATPRSGSMIRRRPSHRFRGTRGRDHQRDASAASSARDGAHLRRRRRGRLCRRGRSSGGPGRRAPGLGPA